MEYKVSYDAWVHDLPRSERRHFTMKVKADSVEEAKAVAQMSFTGKKINVTQVTEVIGDDN